MKIKILFSLAVFLVITSCSSGNDKPTYGESGLPKNCRAIVQANIDAYRKARNSGDDYGSILQTTDDIFESLDRNCGDNGYSW